MRRDRDEGTAYQINRKVITSAGKYSKSFVQYMDSDREYTADDKLYMREAHFVIAIGPGEGRT